MPDCEAEGGPGEVLYQRVYRHQRLLSVRKVARRQLREMLDILAECPEWLPAQFQIRAASVGSRRSVADCLAGSTDRCRQQYKLLVG